MKNFFLTVLLLFGGCDKIILGTKYNADLDICTGVSTNELPLPPNICTNMCHLFRCPANYTIVLCDTDPTIKRIDHSNGVTRITKYFIDDKLVSGTFADSTKVCSWGSLSKGCEGSFTLVKEERCY